MNDLLIIIAAIRREAYKWSHLAKYGGNSDIAAALNGIAEEIEEATRGVRLRRSGFSTTSGRRGMVSSSLRYYMDIDCETPFTSVKEAKP